ncbi:ParB/RepB/Spo0J family partition protein [Thiohalomonas denitrificans]|uniref:Probable chromosome-partitioning protein ParB n=1 Tax=Thiohalomonas denitrificans TaxID=415747 RepID=A0A1G5QRJ6_9GAMM|nr:ParB/RepB/Spo0J family partition protein [Thiohalomonas denitrificans]SCZ64372.1 chromosome partitioning protein, ParB family [Thiohalomonas denitrificans]
MATRKRRLGKGLDALLGAGSSPAEATGDSTGEETHDSEFRHLPVDVIQRGKYQPRLDMHPDTLEELADSIRSQGVVQPIVVRPLAQKGRYEIIAGERRWRAAQIAGLHEIPAVIRDVPDEAAIAMALIENIQREELNAMEEAHALQRLVDEFGMTHQQVAEAVGRSRAAVSNLLRLLSLAPDVKRLVENGDLEMGHARALLGLSGDLQSQAARQVVGKGLSVRETEKLVKRLCEGAPEKAPEKKVDPDIRRLEESLGERIGARVAIQHGPKGKGKLVIQYNTLDELDGILEHIS